MDDALTNMLRVKQGSKRRKVVYNSVSGTDRQISRSVEETDTNKSGSSFLVEFSRGGIKCSLCFVVGAVSAFHPDAEYEMIDARGRMQDKTSIYYR